MGNAPIVLVLSLVLLPACAGDPFVFVDADAVRTTPPAPSTSSGSDTAPPDDAGAGDAPVVGMIDARTADRALVGVDVLEVDANAGQVDAAPDVAEQLDAAAPLDAPADRGADAPPPGALCCAGGSVAACSPTHFVCYPSGSTCSETCGAGVDGAMVCQTSCSGAATGTCADEGACAVGAPCVVAAGASTLPGSVAPCPP